MIDEIYCIIDFTDERNNFEKIMNLLFNKINFKKVIIIVKNENNFQQFVNNKMELKVKNYTSNDELKLLYCDIIEKNKSNNIIIITNTHKDFKDIESLNLGLPHLLLNNDILSLENKRAKDSKIIIKNECFYSIFGSNLQLLKSLNYAKKAKNSNLKSCVIYGSKGTGRTLLANQIMNQRSKMELNPYSDFNNQKLNGDSFIVIKDIDKFSLIKQQELTYFINKNNEKIIKVVSTASKNLVQLVSKDLFLPDLLEIISECDITVPDLKDRPDDFEYLSYQFLKETLNKYNQNITIKLTPDALKAMRHYSWPLNITELQMVLRKALFLCEPTQEFENDANSLIITEAELNLDNNFLSTDLKPLGGSFKLSEELRNLEKRYIKKALENKKLGASIVAKLLGLSGTSALYSKLNTLKIANPFEKDKNKK